MKRGRQKNPREYIKIRIEQLLEDRKKEKDSFSRQWIWRVISELMYVATMMDKDKENKESWEHSIQIRRRSMIETHKRQLERWQSKLGISNYGIAWIAFFKGMIFGVLVYHFLIA